MVIVLSPSVAGSLARETPSCAPPPETSGKYVVDMAATSQDPCGTTPGEARRPSLRKLLRSLLPWRKKGPDVKSEAESSATTSRPSMSLLEQSIAIMRTSSIRSLGKSFRKHSHVDMLDETWEDWLEQYQAGETNLSTLSRPVCFCGFGHMAPPHHKNEMARLRSVDAVSDRRIWRHERAWLDEQLRALLVQHRIKAATVSLIEKTCQVVLQDIGLGKRFSGIDRELSLDAHTILSAEYFTLLDAGTDWRTRLNPLVHGPPFIKFYIGVPIFINEQPVGCLALLDPYLKAQVPKELVAQLTAVSRELSKRVQARVDEVKSAKSKARVQWADEDEGDGLSVLTVASSGSGCTSASAPSDVELGMAANPLSAAASMHGSRVFPLSGPQASRSVLQPYEVFESLLRCRSIPQAIKKACRIVWQNLGSELVYIVEARLRRQVLVPAASLRQLRSGAALRSIDAVREAAEPALRSRVRLVGHYGPQLEFDAEAEIMADKETYRTALASRYGIRLTASEDSSAVLQSSLLMPFRRKPERVTWDEDAVRDGADVPCMVWTDGFVMGASVSHVREFSPGDVVFMKKVVRAVENILTCRDDQGALWNERSRRDADSA